ncbi:MAG: nucleotidyl transferase AbiEii/AbiGii toxin family protein [Candidatus Binataceae bacterium]
MAKRKKLSIDEELQRLEEIKRLVVIAMFSDDMLMERLVLKGGNALDIIHQISARASLDVDFSMAGDFSDKEEREVVRGKIESALIRTFRDAGYQVFDVKMEDKPEGLTADLADFWGGYGVEFKLIELDQHQQFAGDIEKLRRNALQFNPGASAKFTIDISKFEYTVGKEAQDLRGYRIFVYSPEMIVCEKLRAICQQTAEYGSVVKRSRTVAPRARDFLDIRTIVVERGLNMCSPENISLLSKIFEAKRVPLSMLDLVPKYREFHRQDFPAVQATVKPGVKLENFDFYFDFVVDLARKIRAKDA